MTTLINKSTMKNSILMLAMAVFIAACGGGSKDPKAQLEKLKSQRADLEAKITALEEEVAKTDTTGDNEKRTEVLTVELQPQIFKTYLEVQGHVDADESVSLSTEMPGTVTKINVKVGNRVSKGDVLAETDSRATQQQIADLQTNLDLVSQVYEKQKNLWEQKIGTEIQYLQAKTNKESLEKKIAAMQEQIRMSKIISPIDGTVDLINLKIGQMAAPQMGVITVVNFSNLKLKADMSESYSTRVKNGSEVIAIFPDMKDSVTTKINYASRAINPMTRTFAIEALLDGKKEYHPNTVARLKVNDYVSPVPVLVIPVKYIQKSSEGSFVMIDENGTAVQKMVTLGHEYSGYAEVTSGLKTGDKLITAGYDLIIDGTKIVSK
ncbi:MAG: efflux RND transporter periplasmic adaptor subunit [Bacteroidetes bacterium]|nr:efflux RND transporter periplasmic adaptor subunit [Bacteroidota bacterium]